jgi:carbon storage regulator
MTMLVLSRRFGEKVCIGNDVTLVVLEVKGDRVRIGFTAPRYVPIFRKELLDRLPGLVGEELCQEMIHASGNL